MAGDQVAFFNPQGNLCGLYTVNQNSPAGFYGPLSVSYEGAQAGDVLTVRIWDSRYQVELSGGDVLLSAGLPSGYWIASPIPPAWNDGAQYILNITTVTVPTTHFPVPSGVNGSYVSDFTGSLTILGQAAQPGDEVAFFDPRGDLVGSVVVGQAGVYPILHVYGDDPSTSSVLEGARQGELLSVKVWDKSAQVEYDALRVSFAPGQSQGSFVPSPIPPRWSADSGYMLDITVSSTAFDTYTLSMGPGWNFVSLPLQPEYPAPDVVLAAILDRVDIVWGYDNHTKAWLSYRPGSQQSQTLLAINADRGYWIHLKEEVTLRVIGSFSSSPVSLETGWNLIGYHGQEGRSPTLSLQQIGNTWSLIWGWSEELWRGEHISQNISPVPKLTELNRGKAYWIKLNSNAGNIQWVQ